MNATLTKKIILNYIKSLKKESSSEYIFICDFDAKGDNSICITIRKDKAKKEISNVLESNKILVVKEEIESWYLAGINEFNLNRFKIKQYTNTELINKEQFVKLIPKKFEKKTNFLIAILKEFDLEIGKNKNASLKYFITKFTS